MGFISRSKQLLALLLFICLSALHVADVIGLDNGLARTPPMGFNTWNAFACNISEKLLMEHADALVRLGLADAGYVYLNLDDCWQHEERDPITGDLRPHLLRFPSGIPAISNYAHAKGLKLGIYSDAGYLTCEGLPGSLDHEAQDALLFSSWDVDYVKLDFCHVPDFDVLRHYSAMREALLAAPRPMVFSLCSWGVGTPWVWGKEVGNSWRIDGDVWESWSDILRSLDSAIGLSRFAGPGGWNDPDMLEVGNGGLSLEIQRSHFALWCLLKAPLLIGTDLRTISDESLAILKAREVIAINQDPLGVAGDLVWQEGLSQVWAAPVAGGARAVVLFNRGVHTGPPTNITVTWAMLGYPEDTQVAVRELYDEADFQGVYFGSIMRPVAGQDVAVLRITPNAYQQGYDDWRPWHSPMHKGLAAAADEARARMPRRKRTAATSTIRAGSMSEAQL